MKKVVVVQYKQAKRKERIYRTCPELILANPKSKIGIGLGALWNALSKNGGVFENNLCRIFYRDIDNKSGSEWT